MRRADAMTLAIGSQCRYSWPAFKCKRRPVRGVLYASGGGVWGPICRRHLRLVEERRQTALLKYEGAPNG